MEAAQVQELRCHVEASRGGRERARSRSELSFLVEGLQLVGLHWGLILVQVRQWILGAVVVSIIVRIDGLCLQARNGVKLLDRGGAQASQRTEDRALDLRHLSVLDGVDKCVLSLRRVILELL